MGLALCCPWNDRQALSVECRVLWYMRFMVPVLLYRLRTGYVTRLVLEDGLRQHCRHALHSLSAPALLDLMDAHAAGVLAAVVSCLHCLICS